MARATTKKPGTEVVDWEKEMASQAQTAAETQRSSGGGGQFFSTQGGILQFGGTPMPGNQMAVIILADILENSWYEGAYDPSTPASPKCFAFARTEDELEPHEAVDNDDYFERQHATCDGCPRNEWGSAAVGRGKDCKNVQRLSLIPAGVYTAKGPPRNQTFELELYDDVEHYARAEEAFLKLPVMSVKEFAVYVKQLNADVRRPPHGVFTNIYIVPDAKSQYRVKFEVIDNVPNELLATIMERHRKAAAAIDFPYNPPLEADEVKPQASANKLRRKAAARKR